jgi:hypothetical protein
MNVVILGWQIVAVLFVFIHIPASVVVKKELFLGSIAGGGLLSD